MEVELDLYLPPEPEPGPQSVSRSTTNSPKLLPCLVYFHGGGLTVGNKTSWFPFWTYGLSLSPPPPLGLVFGYIQLGER